MRYQKKLTIQNKAVSPVVKGRVAVGVCVLLFPLLLTGCDDGTVAPASLRPVKTWTVPVAQRLPAITWTGTIEPSEEVTLHFRIDGQLAEKEVDVGTKVAKEQIVATLNGSQRREDAAAAIAEYKEAVAAEKKSYLELERTRKLFAIGTVSSAQLEEATASLETLTARKVRAQAQRSAALNESGFSILRAPFDGVVTAYIPHPGQSITAGQDVLKIASRQAEVQFSISSALASKLYPGDHISVRYGEVRTEGQLRYISPQLDAATRTSMVRATLTDQKTLPVFGSPVAVELYASDDTGIPLPATAITRSGNQPAVFVVDQKNGTLESRAVTIARFSLDRAYVSAGLKPGEKVVTAGVNTLENGEKVAIRSEGVK